MKTGMNEFNTIDFENKWVVVTGASSGIGQGIARALAACNANLVLIGRNQETLAKTAENIPAENVKLLVIDLSDSGTIVPLMKSVVEEAGAIYGFCHCAGIVDTRPINVTTPDSILKQLNINLIAGTEIVRALVKKGASRVNHRLGLLDEKIAGAIADAAQEVMEGRFDDQFVVFKLHFPFYKIQWWLNQVN